MEIVAIAVLVGAALVSSGVVLVVARRHGPWLAFITGGLTTCGTTILVGLAIIVAWLSLGVFDDAGFFDCELVCGPIVLFMGVSTMAYVGGFVSALASLALVRPKDSDQP